MPLPLRARASARVLNELAINFSYRRIRRGMCRVSTVYVLELLYKLINRTLGAGMLDATSAINENEMAYQRGRLLLLWFFFCRLRSSTNMCDAKQVGEMGKKRMKRNEFIADLWFGIPWQQGTKHL